MRKDVLRLYRGNRRSGDRTKEEKGGWPPGKGGRVLRRKRGQKVTGRGREGFRREKRVHDARKRKREAKSLIVKEEGSEKGGLQGAKVGRWIRRRLRLLWTERGVLLDYAQVRSPRKGQNAVQEQGAMDGAKAACRKKMGSTRSTGKNREERNRALLGSRGGTSEPAGNTRARGEPDGRAWSNELGASKKRRRGNGTFQKSNPSIRK